MLLHEVTTTTKAYVVIGNPGYSRPSSLYPSTAAPKLYNKLEADKIAKQQNDHEDRSNRGTSRFHWHVKHIAEIEVGKHIAGTPAVSAIEKLKSKHENKKLREETCDKLQVGVSVLSESIVDFLGATLAKLKHAHPEEVFSEHNPDKVSIEELAKLITGLKIISNKDHREVITKDDVGINPNSAREVFQLLDDVKKDGKHDKDVMKIFGKLADLSPSIYNRELDKLKVLKKDGDAHDAALMELEKFMLKVSQMFQKLKTGTVA